MKAADGHTVATAETYKLNNVCNAGFPRSQANASPRVSAEYAQRSITISIYHKIVGLSSEKHYILCILMFQFYIWSNIVFGKMKM